MRQGIAMLLASQVLPIFKNLLQRTHAASSEFLPERFLREIIRVSNYYSSYCLSFISVDVGSIFHIWLTCFFFSGHSTHPRLPTGVKEPSKLHPLEVKVAFLKAS